jgi:DNA-binding transcriptional MocR family regulator
MIVDGTFDRHLAALRAEHRRRRDAMMSALERHGSTGKLQWTVPEGGLYLWCRLSGRLKASQVHAHALAESIAFVRGEAFYVDQAGEREIRICFSTVVPSCADDVAKRIVRAINAAKRDLASPSPMVAIV